MAALSTLVDDFADGVVDTVKWPNNYGTVTEPGGRGRLACDTSYNAYASAATYTFDSFFLRAYPPALSGATSVCYLDALLDSAAEPAGTNLGFAIDLVAGQVGLISWVGFFDAAAVYLTYDSVAHAWIRLVKSGSNVLWQTAPDGSTWTTRRTAVAPTWLSASDISVLLESHRSDGTNNFAEVDNFNVLPFSTVNGTAAATLGGLTAAASGVRGTPGTGAAPLGGLTAAAAGVRTTPGTAVAALGGAVAAAAGTRTTPAASSITLGGLAAAVSGVREVSATATAALGPISPLVVGSREVVVAAAADLGGVTTAAAGVREMAAAATALLGGLAAAAVAQSSMTHRPDAGVTSRPGSGVTVRPYAGVTARP